jgi:hypothetical protein
MAGKWHLGQTKEQLPASQWFEDSVLLGEGGGADSILYPILFSALGANPLGASLSAKYAFTEASISAREARGRSTHLLCRSGSISPWHRFTIQDLES